METRAAVWARTVCAAALCAVVAACGGDRPEKAERPVPSETGEPVEPSGSESAEPFSSGAPSPEPTRLSPSRLQGEWWTWAAAEAVGSNPVEDEDGSFCGVNQPDKVWFLAGTFGGHANRSCSVPGGVPVAFPLVNMVGTDDVCEDFMASAAGTARLDGKTVEPERLSGVGIEFMAAPDNPVTAESGYFTATACGLWVQLPPPEPGTHHLEIRGSAEGFSVSVDYELEVGDDPGPSSHRG